MAARKSPVKLPFAYPDPATQLHDTAVRAARKPLDSGQDGLVEGGGIFHRGKKNLAEGCLPGCGAWLLDYLFKPHALHGALDVRNWNYLVQQF